MSAFSNYLEDKLLRLTLLAPAEPYIALFTTPTGDQEGIGAEVVGNGYLRIRATFTEPAADADEGMFCANDTDLRSPQPSTGPWGVVSHFAVYDAAAGGNRLYHGALQTPRAIETNDLFFALAGDIKIKLK